MQATTARGSRGDRVKPMPGAPTTSSAQRVAAVRTPSECLVVNIPCDESCSPAPPACAAVAASPPLRVLVKQCRSLPYDNWLICHCQPPVQLKFVPACAQRSRRDPVWREPTGDAGWLHR